MPARVMHAVKILRQRTLSDSVFHVIWFISPLVGVPSQCDMIEEKNL